MNQDATLHIRLDKSLKEVIEEIALEFHVKPAVIVRMALEQYVDNRPEPTTIMLDDEPNNTKINISSILGD